jgi:hypothetical protein
MSKLILETTFMLPVNFNRIIGKMEINKNNKNN